MNAPDAVARRSTFQREGQGQLQDPEHGLPAQATDYAVLKAQLTGNIPRLTAEPPDFNQRPPITEVSDAACGHPHQADTSTPPSKPSTVTSVADTLASTSRPPTSGPIQAVIISRRPVQLPLLLIICGALYAQSNPNTPSDLAAARSWRPGAGTATPGAIAPSPLQEGEGKLPENAQRLPSSAGLHSRNCAYDISKSTTSRSEQLDSR